LECSGQNKEVTGDERNSALVTVSPTFRRGGEGLKEKIRGEPPLQQPKRGKQVGEKGGEVKRTKTSVPLSRRMGHGGGKKPGGQ